MEQYGIEAAMWGFGVEVGTHAVRLMNCGVFDRFPRLRICIGHMGEAIPFWLWRINFMNTRGQHNGRSPKTELTMEEYFKRNFAITTSGVEDPVALDYCIKRIGIDNIMWAIDYPYQPMPPAIAFMDSAPVTDEERAKLYHKNAERIFHITPLPDA
jgi:2,3-dihydroxybenzoate decarboxylase/5-carboxyvanillate decarboxylase